MEKFKKYWPFLLMMVLVFILGYLTGGNRKAENPPPVHVHENVREDQFWTCSMHPQIRQSKPGKCPLCSMDLIPVERGGPEDKGVPVLKLSERGRRLASIRTAPVERRHVAKKIRLSGKVDVDETKVREITARFSGRIDRLYVDFTGTGVRKGDLLVSLYSPQLISAQRELIEARKISKKTENAVREKLRLLGLTSRQIKNMEISGEVKDHVPMYSPIGGIVIRKHANEGTYVQTGTRIYTVADLSHVWVKLDAYESDLVWLREDQRVVFETEAYRGDTFRGKISFIDPVVDRRTRTVTVRVDVPNHSLKLKPEMFVHAVVQSELTVSGRAAVPGSSDGAAPLVIPASAPLLTGTRAVVYVAIPGEEGTFEGRTITLGPRAGDYYLVAGGLTEGELVVVSGGFKIDSDLQLQAKPSMMNPSEDIQSEGKIPVKISESLDRVTGAYFDVQDALSSDDLPKAKNAVKRVLNALSRMDERWLPPGDKIRGSCRQLLESSDINGFRMHFEHLTAAVTESIKKIGSSQYTVYRMHCPMAFDNRGAFWLQNHSDTRNPYFGAMMLTCRDSVEILVSGEKRKDHQ